MTILFFDTNIALVPAYINCNNQQGQPREGESRREIKRELKDVRIQIYLFCQNSKRFCVEKTTRITDGGGPSNSNVLLW